MFLWKLIQNGVLAKREGTLNTQLIFQREGQAQIAEALVGTEISPKILIAHLINLTFIQRIDKILRVYLQNKGLRECDVFDSPALGSAQVDA